MSEKLIVHFKELPVLPYQMDYLTYCKHCGSYNLASKPCVNCDQVAEIALEEMAAKTVSKHLIIRELIVIGFYAALFVLAKEWQAILFATLFTIGCLVINILVYKKYKDEMILHEVDRHIHLNIEQIKADLAKQMSIAIRDVEEGNPVEAYNRFRYLAKLIDNEEVRIYKLICLKNFKLRSDMPLELTSLLQEECNTYLIDYIYEVSKLKKGLIDDATLTYIVQYKEQVLERHKGRKMMASILEGALKSKFLLNKYAQEMIGYLKDFSEDRLLRLCKMNTGIKDEVVRNKLLSEARQIVGEDKRFAKYFEDIRDTSSYANYTIEANSASYPFYEMDEIKNTVISESR